MHSDAGSALLPDSSPQAAPSSDKREALMRAALELFAERTYGATPVPDIAARAHVGTGTVYRHFASKEALANAVFRRCKTAMNETLRTALDGGGSEAERFLRLWQGLASMAAADPTALRFLELQHHEDYLDDESRALSDSVFATAEAFVTEGQRTRAIRPANPRAVIAMVFGAFVGLFKESCAGRYALDNAAVVDAGDCAWRMIAGDSPR